MVSMRDIANIANVSVSTVSAVVNRNKYVSPALQMHVESVIRETGYQMSSRMTAKSILQNEVGLILPGIYSSYFQPLLSGIEDVAGREGYNVILCDSDRRWEKERMLLDRLIARGVRNLILDSVCSCNNEVSYFNEILLPLTRTKDVMIYMLSRQSPYEEIGSFSIDHYKMAYQATEYLVRIGHTKIAHISGDPTFPHSALRIQGYRKALEESGIKFDEQLLLEGDFSPISGYATMNELLRKGIPVDAVFSANDQMAIGAMKAILHNGLRVPEDMAVVGFDDLSVSSIVSPSLTTVHYPIYQMGYGAMRNIVDARAGRDVTKQVHLDAKLVVRKSTDASYADDWELSRW